jgi:hypothetical protein
MALASWVMMFDETGVADLTINTWTFNQLDFDWEGGLTWSIKTIWDFTFPNGEADAFGNTSGDHTAEHPLHISSPAAWI